MSTHACPGGCGAQVASHQLACPPDWFRLPKPLRRAVNTAWNKRVERPGAHRAALEVALRWYRDNPREDLKP